MKKKIFLITTYCLIALVVISVIVVALIPYSNAPEISKPNEIVFYQNSSVKATWTGSETKFDKLVEMSKTGHSENLLTAFLTGKTQIPTVKPISQKSLGDLYIKFKYEEPQEFSQRGKAVKNPTDNSKNLKYNYVYFNISSEDKVATVTYYLEFVDGSSSSYYSVNHWANQIELYDFVVENCIA